MSELKPCPFCGGGTTQIKVQQGTWTGVKWGEPISVSVFHWCDPVPGQPSRGIERIGRDEASAVAAWNMRQGARDDVGTEPLAVRGKDSGARHRRDRSRPRREGEMMDELLKVLRDLVALEADGKHADESAVEVWERARAMLAAGGAAMKPPPMPTENHCGTCGAGVTYRSQDVAARDAQWAAIVAILERNNEIKHAQIQNAADEVARLRQELADLERQLRVAKAKHSPEYLQERINLAVAQERERCARVCEAADKSTHPADLADAIRAQTNSKEPS